MGRHKTVEEIYQEAYTKGVDFDKSKINRMRDKCPAKCLVCGFYAYENGELWMPMPVTVIKRKGSCPGCYKNRRRITIEEIYDRSYENGVEFDKSKIHNMLDKCPAKCLICKFDTYKNGKSWMPKPSVIIYKITGCPKCDELRTSERMKDNNIAKIYSCNDNYFSNLTDEVAWVLGLWAADGHVLNPTNTVAISQSDDYGLKLLKYIKKILQYTGPIYDRHTTGIGYISGREVNRVNAYMLNILSKQMKIDLEKYNIVPAKSLIYKYPENLPIEYLYPFLRGLLDGDGSVFLNKKENIIGISLIGNKELIHRLKELIPVKCSVYIDKKTKNCWVIRWAGNNAIELGEIIYGEKYDHLYKYVKYDRFWKKLKIVSKPTKHERFLLKKKGKVLKIIQKKGNRKKINVSEMVRLLDIDPTTIKKWIKEYSLGINTGVGRGNYIG